MSYILRHAPQEIGVTMDEFGWVSIEEFVEKANQSGKKLGIDIVMETVKSCTKKRFTISGDGRSIRAAQGHSVPVALEHDPITPPDVLFHGTAERFLSSIEEQGLLPKSRNYVHLSRDVKTALEVGKRYGKPIILKIDTKRMSSDGEKFWCAENGVWLCKGVLPDYFEVTANA